MPDEVSIIDTSSIIRVREIVVRTEQTAVFRKLTDWVENDKLVYPKEVFAELERYSNPDPNFQDLPLDWAQANIAKATRYIVPFEIVKAVLAQVPDVLDPDKQGVEEADPYVMALAILLQGQGLQVTVLTEERKDRPGKISMTTACGHLRLVCLPMDAFLSKNSIWRRSG